MDSPMMNFENRPTDAALTPKAQKEFEKIFCQWMDEEWNQERLLLGGTGNSSNTCGTPRGISCGS